MPKEKTVTLEQVGPRKFLQLVLEYDEVVVLYSTLEQQMLDLQSQYGRTTVLKRQDYKKIEAMYKQLKKALTFRGFWGK